ncbi:hypothetical protein MMPV_003039 [Pyropia vietnamensis]
MASPAKLPVVDAEQERFEVELEFVQCLSTPAYLQFLAQNRYFEDPAFLRYLSYLSYWRRPEYARFLTHPSCLYFLGALRHPSFRAAIAHDDYMALVHAQQGFAWQFGGGGRAASAGSAARAFEGEGESVGGGGRRRPRRGDDAVMLRAAYGAVARCWG